MKRKRAFLSLITMILIIAVDSTKETVVRLEMAHRETLWPSPFRHIEDIIGQDHKRHNMITQKRKTKGGGIKMPLGSGIDYGSAQYFTELMVGTPAKKFRLVVDTGSELTWVNCRFHGKGQERVEDRDVFRAGESSSFRKVGCLTQTCKVDLMNLFSLSICPTPSTPCSYDYRYADGSGAQGVFSKETITVGLTDGRNTTITGLLLGCSTSFNGESFRGSDGVLGLAFSDYSFTTKVTKIFGGKFSYCLVNHRSTKNISNYLTFGSASSSSSTKTAAKRTTQLNLDIIPPFYGINVIGISLGEEMLNIPKKVWDVDAGGGSILDSGTSLTLLADAAYKEVVTGLERYLVKLKRVQPEGVPIEYCYDTTVGFNESILPQLTFHFKDGARFEPHRGSYMVDTTPGVKCLGFVSAGVKAINVVGNIMQQNHLWQFDLVASTLYFAASTCL